MKGGLKMDKKSERPHGSLIKTIPTKNTLCGKREVTVKLRPIK